jgi:hypothetical protein
MQIKPQDIKAQKQIGHMEGRPVFQIGLKGGLFLLATLNKSGNIEIMGSGPHQTVARHIAKKLHPQMVITELAKSEELEERTYVNLVPFYVNLTDRLNKARGE